MNLIFLGAPGAGKGTQTKKLIKEFGFIHLSTGDILRQLIRVQDPLGIKAKSYIDDGKLVPDSLVIKMIQKMLKQSSGYSFDGFPRTLDQAIALDHIATVDRVIYLFIERDEVLKRLSGRRVCENCGKEYHILFLPSSLGDKCEVCKGKLYQRDDDNPSIIEKRLKVYEEQTKPLLDYYREKLCTIIASASIASIYKEILNQLNLDSLKRTSTPHS